ncbi:MAG: DOMON domain-containing protein [Myxococcota bacterium]
MIAIAGAFASVTAGGVTFDWSVEEGVLTGRASARAEGWVCVGFNARPQLAGSVLVLGAARPDGTSAVVEHIARPPRHPDRGELGTPGLLEATATEVDGTTTVVFRLRLDTGDGLAEGLEVGAFAHLTLAWSRSDDFDHHSAERVLVPVVL